MANFRRFRPDDVNKFSKCNLDPFTETYELGFYLQYHAKWPSLFQVAEDQDGNIIGYSEISPPLNRHLLLHALTTSVLGSWIQKLSFTHVQPKIVMGKLESSPSYIEGSEHYLPWHAHITALTVAPEARRLGIAQLLCEQLEATADANNAWFVDLFVRASNTRAIQLYKKLGYSVFRVVKDYYGDNPEDPSRDSEDAYDMRKSMKRDVKGEHVREDGMQHEVNPEDVW